jgi:hypothetical protein
MASPATTYVTTTVELRPGLNNSIGLPVNTVLGFNVPPATTVASGSNSVVLAGMVQLAGGQSVTGSSLNVVSGGLTAAFPPSGAIVIQTTTGLQTISYTSITPNTSFNGCTGGSTATTTTPCTATAATCLLASGQAANASTLNVAPGGSTAHFPSVGSITIQTSAGLQTIAYTSITPNTSFNGCTGGGAGTTSSPCVATLYSLTINVGATAGFPTSGRLTILTSGGLQTIVYTGTTPTTFTGCIVGTATGFLTSTASTVVNPQYLFMTNSAGALQIVSYTGISGNTFTGCSGGTGTVLQNALSAQARATTTTASFSPGNTTLAVTSVANFNLNTGVSGTDATVLLQDTAGNWQTLYFNGTAATGNTLTGVSGGNETIALGAPAVLGLQTFGSSAPQTLPSSGTYTLNCTDTSAFPSNGIIGIVTSAGFQLISHTGTGGNTFTGCSGGTGTFIGKGLIVGVLPSLTTCSTTVSLSSSFTINVPSGGTTNFPMTGTLTVLTTANGYQLVSYTGTTSTSFTGCSSAGTGSLPSGNAVFAFNGIYGPVPGTPAVVQNYAQLRSLPAPAFNSTVQVLGANAPGDGGDGVFVWDQNTPPSGNVNDNVGIVLQSLVATPGRWRRAGFPLVTNSSGTQVDTFSSAINVRWFGATGNGTEDDTAAFSSAFTAIGNAGVLELPLGTYRIASNLTIPTGVTLLFRGGIIKPDNGVTVTFSGGILAPPLQQIFSFTSNPSATPIYFTQARGGAPTSYVTWWGAVGDGATDNYQAFQRCLDAYSVATATPTGGEIIIPNGIYLISQTLNFYHGQSYLNFHGASRSSAEGTGAYLAWTSTDGTTGIQVGERNGNLVGNGACTNARIANVVIQMGTSGGPAMCVGVDASNTNPWSANSGVGADASTIQLDDVSLSTYNPAVQTFRCRGMGHVFHNLKLVAQAGRSVPAVYIDGGNDTVVGSPSLEMGQAGDIKFTGFTQFQQATSTHETAPYCIIEARGTGLGVQNISFEDLRTEQLQHTAVLVSGCWNVDIKSGVYADSFGTLPAPCFEWTYNTNDSQTHFANFCALRNMFIQVADSNSNPSLLAVGNPGGGSGGPLVEMCSVELIKSTNCVFLLSATAYAALATGSQLPINLQANGSTLGAGGLSSTATASNNLAGSVTVANTATTATVTFANPESDTNYKLTLTCTGPAAAAVGSNRVLSISKSTGGFTITVEAAANVNTTTFDWHLFR